MDKSKHRAIYDHGEGYLHSVMKLQHGLSNPPDPEEGEQFHIITSAMIAGVALELFLKALYYLNLETAPPDGHTLQSMVEDLPDQVQTRLKQKYREHRDPETLQRFEEKTGVSVASEFDAVLAEHQQVFEQVRTIYDRSEPIQMPTLFAMIQAVKQVYVELAP